MMKILIVVTSINMYASGNHPTGLWLSELTHLYHEAKEKDFEITIASTKGGNTPIDPESLKTFTLDKLSKSYWEDKEFMKLLQDTKSLKDVATEQYDCVYLTGGHGTMYDFPDDAVLQKIIREHYENKKLVSAICHGVGGLLNVKLSNGQYLIKEQKITGYSWFEETLANRKKEVPFNLEQQLKDRGADYTKGFIPLTSKVCENEYLMTGQNPFSSKEMARKLISKLTAKKK